MSTFDYPKLNPDQTLLSEKEVEYIKHFLKDIVKHEVNSYHSFDIQVSEELVEGLKENTDKSKLRLSLPTIVEGFESNGVVEKDYFD